jgi:hypothetical protein
VNTQTTALQSEGGITQSNLIRHKNGMIQKQGGCQAISSALFSGTARCLFAWEDLTGNDYIGIGTNKTLELYSQGSVINIMPIAQTDNLTAPFNTVAGDTVVTVVDGAASVIIGDLIDIVNAVYVDGIFLQGIYSVIAVGTGTYDIDSGQRAIAGVTGGGTVVDFSTTNGQSFIHITVGAQTFVDGETLNIGVATTVGGLVIDVGAYGISITPGPVYSILLSSAATSTATAFENGGDVRIAYLASLPPESVSAGAYGSGPYGEGPYGTGVPINNTNLWTMDKWGQNLVAAYRGGTILQWVPPIAINNVSAPVAGAPSIVNGIFTAAPEQQLIAFGAFSAALGEQDPLLVAWCDVADLNDWTASTTNQAGSFRLSSGSKIVSGMWAGTIGLLWTDIDFWIMTYVGFPLIYGFNQAYRNCGLISLRGAAIVGATIEWMSQNDFFVFQGGTVSPLPCSVRDFVFDNIDQSNLDAVFAAPNGYFDEITWWFPTVGSNGICTSYVRHNVVENLWDCGPLPAPPLGFIPLQLSAWCDQSVFGPPIGAFYNGILEQFEKTDDIDGSVYDSWMITGWFQLAQGEEFVFLERIMPDFILTGVNPQINVTVYISDYMNGPVSVYGPFVITPETEFIPIRTRSRLCMLRIDCISPNTFWRYGKPLAVIAADGRQ